MTTDTESESGNPVWYRSELIFYTEPDCRWQLHVDGHMVGITGPVDAGEACAWANVYLGRDLGWVPGWPHQVDACWYWVAEPVPELTAAQAEQVLTQLLHAQLAGDQTRMAAIRARMYPHHLSAVVSAAERELGRRLIAETERELQRAAPPNR
ncbi:hypothetical protein ACWDWO_12805 [Actinopolymorpha singaporensis]|uniref:Uncharacterized protein n=1 Tax=Actinopolymorpha singaporensis TaxID=117157 RepID=A0A1H1UMN6_9ACTN|nr:hypothetical protein [Actinopolymorpha singaporensis]SDS73571.1 hypothetical protein SAMN04489717_3689 [Actinopolymorpha singaporensis]